MENSDSGGRHCRVCLQQRGHMIRPCACKGTIGYVHEKCLTRWVCLRRSLRCEVCRRHFTASRVMVAGAPENYESCPRFTLLGQALTMMAMKMGNFAAHSAFVVLVWIVGIPAIVFFLYYPVSHSVLEAVEQVGKTLVSVGFLPDAPDSLVLSWMIGFFLLFTLILLSMIFSVWCDWCVANSALLGAEVDLTRLEMNRGMAAPPGEQEEPMGAQVLQGDLDDGDTESGEEDEEETGSDASADEEPSMETSNSTEESTAGANASAVVNGTQTAAPGRGETGSSARVHRSGPQTARQKAPAPSRRLSPEDAPYVLDIIAPTGNDANAQNLDNGVLSLLEFFGFVGSLQVAAFYAVEALIAASLFAALILWLPELCSFAMENIAVSLFQSSPTRSLLSMLWRSDANSNLGSLREAMRSVFAYVIVFGTHALGWNPNQAIRSALGGDRSTYLLASGSEQYAARILSIGQTWLLPPIGPVPPEEFFSEATVIPYVRWFVGCIVSLSLITLLAKLYTSDVSKRFTVATITVFTRGTINIMVQILLLGTLCGSLVCFVCSDYLTAPGAPLTLDDTETAWRNLGWSLDIGLCTNGMKPLNETVVTSTLNPIVMWKSLSTLERLIAATPSNSDDPEGVCWNFFDVSRCLSMENVKVSTDFGINLQNLTFVDNPAAAGAILLSKAIAPWAIETFAERGSFRLYKLAVILTRFGVFSDPTTYITMLAAGYVVIWMILLNVDTIRQKLHENVLQLIGFSKKDMQLFEAVAKLTFWSFWVGTALFAFILYIFSLAVLRQTLRFMSYVFPTHMPISFSLLLDSSLVDGICIHFLLVGFRLAHLLALVNNLDEIQREAPNPPRLKSLHEILEWLHAHTIAKLSTDLDLAHFLFAGEIPSPTEDFTFPFRLALFLFIYWILCIAGISASLLPSLGVSSALSFVVSASSGSPAVEVDDRLRNQGLHLPTDSDDGDQLLGGPLDMFGFSSRTRHSSSIELPRLTVQTMIVGWILLLIFTRLALSLQAPVLKCIARLRGTKLSLQVFQRTRLLWRIASNLTIEISPAANDGSPTAQPTRLESAPGESTATRSISFTHIPSISGGPRYRISFPERLVSKSRRKYLVQKCDAALANLVANHSNTRAVLASSPHGPDHLLSDLLIKSTAQRRGIAYLKDLRGMIRSFGTLEITSDGLLAMDVDEQMLLEIAAAFGPPSAWHVVSYVGLWATLGVFLPVVVGAGSINLVIFSYLLVSSQCFTGSWTLFVSLSWVVGTAVLLFVYFSRKRKRRDGMTVVDVFLKYGMHNFSWERVWRRILLPLLIELGPVTFVPYSIQTIIAPLLIPDESLLLNHRSLGMFMFFMWRGVVSLHGGLVNIHGGTPVTHDPILAAGLIPGDAEAVVARGANEEARRARREDAAPDPPQPVQRPPTQPAGEPPVPPPPTNEVRGAPMGPHRERSWQDMVTEGLKEAALRFESYFLSIAKQMLDGILQRAFDAQYLRGVVFHNFDGD